MVEEEEGVITSENFGNESAGNVYPNDVNCTLVIKPPRAGVLTLTVLEFEFEEGYDFWQVKSISRAVSSTSVKWTSRSR